jgi:uncharacterized protein (TIGR03437 family)
VTGSGLLHPAPAYTDERWPLSLARACLCIDGTPARLRLLSPQEISVQVPRSAASGERRVVFFRAGQVSNILSLTVRQFSAEAPSGPVLECRSRPGSSLSGVDRLKPVLPN